MKKLKKQFDVRLGSGLGLLLLFTTLSLASCGEQREFDQPEVADGETVEVTQEIQVNVLPIQNMGAGTRATDQPEKGESVHMSFDTNATTRVDEDMTAAEAEIKSAFLVQFDGANPINTAVVVMDITNAMTNAEPIKPTFRMTAGVKNRVYVISNPATRPSLGMTLATFEAPVTYTPGPLPATGLPTLAYQDIGVGSSFGVFQLKCPLAKVTATVVNNIAGGSMNLFKLKGIPSHYFIRKSDSHANFTLTYKEVALTNGTACYIPENLSGRNEDLIYHKTRCEWFAPSNATYVSLRVDFTDYSLYLGNGSPQDFNVTANYAYNIKATIYGRDGRDLRVGGGISNDAVVKNLSDRETANCYILARPASGTCMWYTFDSTVGGNGQEVLFPSSGMQGIGATVRPSGRLNTVDADVLWITRSYDASMPAESTAVEAYALRNKILVRVDVSDGVIWHNAVIAGRDPKGDITWSWHLWQVNDNILPKRVLFAAITGAPSRVELMDRNLGSPASTYSTRTDGSYNMGLLYQWGRKDPFPGLIVYNKNEATATTPANVIKTAPKVADASLSIATPTTFYTSTDNDWTARNDNLWGIPVRDNSLNNGIGGGRTCNLDRGKKTVYDPCPAGWRVSPDYTYGSLYSGLNPATYFVKNCIWSFAVSYIIENPSQFPEFSYPLAGKMAASNGALSTGTGNYWNASPRTIGANGSTMTLTPATVTSWYDNASRAEGRSVRCAADPESDYYYD